VGDGGSEECTLLGLEGSEDGGEVDAKDEVPGEALLDAMNDVIAKVSCAVRAPYA